MLAQNHGSFNLGKVQKMLTVHIQRRGYIEQTKMKKGGKGFKNRRFSANSHVKCPLGIIMIIIIYLFKTDTKK